MFELLHVCRWRVSLLFQTCIRPFSLPLFLSLPLAVSFCVPSAHLFRLSQVFPFNNFLFLYVYFRTKLCFSLYCSPIHPPIVRACVRFPQCPEVRGRHYLCVDSVESSQLLISFSALLFWGDTPGDSKNIKPCVCIHAHTTRYLGKEVSLTQVCDICLPFLTFFRDRYVTCWLWVCSAHRLAVHMEKPAAAASASHNQDHLLKGSRA